MIGYSIHLQKRNKAANGKLFGVRFGRYCIKNNISVIEVTQQLKVTRQAVYFWFTGETEPRTAMVQKILELYPL